MKKNIIIGIVILVGVLAFCYFAIPKVKNGDVVKVNAEYTNTKYGFVFSLPDSWKGYYVVNNSWEGYSLSKNGGNQILSETGEMILIRHPLWTKDAQRQDIPIMVFTLKQWQDLQNDVFHIGAAPIGPSEIGRNSKYVFALPARYNFSYLTGFEEVEKILQGKPLKAF